MKREPSADSTSRSVARSSGRYTCPPKAGWRPVRRPSANRSSLTVRYHPTVFKPGLWRAASIVLAVVITAYGGLLRLDAVVERYGTVDHPAWARVLTGGAPRWAAPLKPEPHQGRRIAQPYVGGDPINSLRYAREMQTFYQPHVREPVFLAWTRGFLWLLSDQDIAVSFASDAASTPALAGAWLLTGT